MHARIKLTYQYLRYIKKIVTAYQREGKDIV